MIMNTKQSKNVVYQKPSVEILSIAAEQTIMTSSTEMGAGGPEGYDIDKFEFDW